MIRSCCLLLVLVAGAPALADDYRVLFEKAAAAINWNFDDNWAFTETRINNDERREARFDPRLPDGEQWTLLTVDGRSPTEDEREEFLADKKDSDTGDSENRVEIVGVESLELIEETDRRWHFRFVPDEDEVEFVDNVDATVLIRKDGEWLEVIDLRNHSDIRPGFGTKIGTFLVRLVFGPASVNGPIVPKTMDIRVSGRTLLFIGFSESERIEYSDFEYAGDSL